MKFDDMVLKEYLAKLGDLVGMDSASNDLEGITVIAGYLADMFQSIGCLVETVHLDPAAGLSIKVQNKPGDQYDALLLGHMDTVFPRGTAAERPFHIKGDKAYGPGVADMKAGLVSAWLFFRELLAMKNKDLCVCLLINSDEEIGSIYSTPWILHHAVKSKMAIVLEAGREDGSFVIERKGTAKYEIEFYGCSAHAGVAPEDGRSAITEMAHWIVGLERLNDIEKGCTLNTGIVKGGQAANVVADYAYMKLDTRFKDITQYETIRDTLGKMKAAPFINGVVATVKEASYRGPMNPCMKTRALLNVLGQVGAKYGISISVQATGGVSDGNGIASLGIPVIDGFGPVGGHVHSSREYLDIGSVMPRLNLLLDLLLGCEAPPTLKGRCF